jgi:hypothetical protein
VGDAAPAHDISVSAADDVGGKQACDARGAALHGADRVAATASAISEPLAHSDMAARMDEARQAIAQRRAGSRQNRIPSHLRHSPELGQAVHSDRVRDNASGEGGRAAEAQRQCPSHESGGVEASRESDDVASMARQERRSKDKDNKKKTKHKHKRKERDADERLVQDAMDVLRRDVTQQQVSTTEILEMANALKKRQRSGKSHDRKSVEHKPKKHKHKH